MKPIAPCFLNKILGKTIPRKVVGRPADDVVEGPCGDFRCIHRPLKSCLYSWWVFYGFYHGKSPFFTTIVGILFSLFPRIEQANPSEGLTWFTWKSAHGKGYSCWFHHHFHVPAVKLWGCTRAEETSSTEKGQGIFAQTSRTKQAVVRFMKESHLAEKKTVSKPGLKWILMVEQQLGWMMTTVWEPGDGWFPPPKKHGLSKGICQGFQLKKKQTHMMPVHNDQVSPG